MIMRTIDRIIIHCSATTPEMDIGVLEIDGWHRNPPHNYRKIGYHFVIRRDGTVEHGRDIVEVGAHAKGHNYNSVGICMVGGIDEYGTPENNFTLEQFKTLFELLITLHEDYEIKEVLGHRDLPNVNKSCPCFDVRNVISSKTRLYEEVAS